MPTKVIRDGREFVEYSAVELDDLRAKQMEDFKAAQGFTGHQSNPFEERQGPKNGGQKQRGNTHGT